MAAQPQVGYLVALNHSLEEETSSAKVSLSQGLNIIGRANIPIPDKRISRKHLTLSVSSDSSAKLIVEGSNPVVVKSGNGRKRVRYGENVGINCGDIIELIPGNHFFKYVALQAGADNNAQKRHSDPIQFNQKKLRLGTQYKAKASEDTGAASYEEAIRHFHVSREKLPYTFQLLRVQGLPAWANTSCVSIRDVIQGDIVVAILSNYMIDIDWLSSACPTLAKIPHVMLIHGEGDGTLEHMKRKKPTNWVLHKPPLPISYGTHHSKAMLLVYPKGLRIVVHTANLIHVDWNNKSQGLWMQDFPWKDQKNPSTACGFENDLIDYLSALKLPEYTVKLPELGSLNFNPSFFKKFDYNDAAVRLIASVPGYHTGANVKKWGHVKLRSVLQECIFNKKFQNAPLVYQFSSLGSLDVKWMAELASSMSAGVTDDKKSLGLGEPLIVWPTVEDVRCSLEGYAAGNAVPSPQKNVEKEFLNKYWAKWKASHTGRCRAMPHIKTFTRYSGQELAWFLLTSSNLSKAAWGALQKNNSQLMIRSYELGVLFLPSLIHKHGRIFSCTDENSESSKFKNDDVQKTRLVTLNWQGESGDSSNDVVLPVPYELPPRKYSSEDVPWSWERRYNKKDVYGEVWPRHVQLYASQE